MAMSFITTSQSLASASSELKEDELRGKAGNNVNVCATFFQECGRVSDFYGYVAWFPSLPAEVQM